MQKGFIRLKRKVPVKKYLAMRIANPMSVDTPGGTLSGDAGDWLVIDPSDGSQIVLNDDELLDMGYVAADNKSKKSDDWQALVNSKSESD